jgi:hypothetical protein
MGITQTDKKVLKTPPTVTRKNLKCHAIPLNMYDWLLSIIPTEKNGVFTYIQIWMEPILRLWNLQLQRQRCSRLERFSKKKKLFLISKRTRLLVAL